MLEHLIEEIAPGQLAKNTVVVGRPQLVDKSFPKTHKSKSVDKITNVIPNTRKYPDNYKTILADYSGSTFSLDNMTQLISLSDKSDSCMLILVDNPIRRLFSKEETLSEQPVSIPEIIAHLQKSGFTTAIPYYSLKATGTINVIFSDKAADNGITIPMTFADTALFDNQHSVIDPLTASLFAEKDTTLYSLFAEKVVLFAGRNKLSKDLIYLKRSSGRKDKFSIYTSVYVSEGAVFASKTAATSEAVPHLNRFAKRKKIIEAGLNSSVRAVEIMKIRSGSVTFPFLEGENFYTKLSRYIVAGEFEKFCESFDGYTRLFNSFTALDTNPCYKDDYVSIFGTNYNSIQGCVEPGLIDINFDNLIINNNKVTIIDYEWLFDFPIPKKYLITRALYYFFFAHQQKTLQFAEKGKEVTQITEQVHVPTVIYNRLKPYFEDIDLFLAAESGFQAYVQNESTPNPDTTSYEPVPPSPNTLLPDYIKQLSLDLHKARDESESLRIQLEQVFNSTRWKLSSRLASFYNFAKRRK